MKKLSKNKILIISVTIFMVLLTFAAITLSYLFINFRMHNKPFIIDGPAMEPTLKSGQIVKVDMNYKKIDRGDIVIIEIPKEEASKENIKNSILIKRIVALPGERIKIQNEVVTVYNDSNPEGFNPDVQFNLKDTKTPSYSDKDIDMVVPPGNVYVMGDNRTNSLDSRIFGSLPIEKIKGKVN